MDATMGSRGWRPRRGHPLHRGPRGVDGLPGLDVGSVRGFGGHTHFGLRRAEFAITCRGLPQTLPDRDTWWIAFPENLIRRVRRSLLYVHEYADVPLSSILDAVKPGRRPGLTPSCQQASFCYPIAAVICGWGKPTPSSSRSLLRAGPSRSDAHPGPQAGRLRGCIEYRSDLFDTTMEELSRGFERYVAAGAAQPDLAVADLDWRGDAARLEQANSTASPYESERGVLDVFRAFLHLDLRPRRHDGARSLTYGELDTASNRLAQHLREPGVDRDLAWPWPCHGPSTTWSRSWGC